MFLKLDKFDGLYLEERAEGGVVYIVRLCFGCYLGYIFGERIFGGEGDYIWGSINGILRY